MSGTTIVLLLVSACCVILFLILLAIRKDLKNALKELEAAQLEIIRKENELEVISNVGKELKESKGRKAPQKIDPPASGDNASRIERLNRL